MSPHQSAHTALTTAQVAHALSYLVVVVAALGLLWYLRRYTRHLLSDPYRGRWRYLAVGIGAAVVYGVAGLAEIGGVAAAGPFRRGATLFVFLFSAIGVRGVHRSVGGKPLLPDAVLRWLAPAVVVGVVTAWWGTFLLAADWVVAAFEIASLAVLVAYTLYHAIGTVQTQEGTSIAAVTRQFVPALLALAVVAVADHAAALFSPAVRIGGAVALVGTALAGAFLFTTAVAIRQQGGEVARMYDPTTWQAGHVDDSD